MSTHVPGLRVSQHQDSLLFSVDGKPVMATGPIKLEVVRKDGVITVTANQDVRTFNQPPK
jgi:hypothetical protein